LSRAGLPVLTDAHIKYDSAVFGIRAGMFDEVTL
jgi:hypothetical protein